METPYGFLVISALRAMVIGFQTVLSIHTILAFKAVSVIQMAKLQNVYYTSVSSHFRSPPSHKQPHNASHPIFP